MTCLAVADAPGVEGVLLAGGLKDANDGILILGS
jgi:hypothetical protein